VKDFLTSEKSAIQYLSQVQQEGHLYPGFNLIVFDGHHLAYYCNSSDEGIVLLKPNTTYGISNSPLSTPWVKTCNGREKLHDLVESYREHADPSKLCNEMLDMLSDTTRVEDRSKLPITGRHTKCSHFSINTINLKQTTSVQDVLKNMNCNAQVSMSNQLITTMAHVQA